MNTYLTLLDDIIREGEERPDRTGTGTISVFGRQAEFWLSNGFPLVTTKQMYWKNVVGELLWMLSGSTNVNDLHKYGVNIWDSWAKENGDLGPIYGKQWRTWKYFETNMYGDAVDPSRPIDQIQQLVDGLKTDPFSRRHVVSAWNPADIPDMVLPPCHAMFQCYVSNTTPRCLDLHMYQRSADAFIGVPYNIACYALLMHMLGHHLGMVPRRLVISYGDLHVYNNHIDQVQTQLRRIPMHRPRLMITADQDQPIDQYSVSDFKLIDYKHYDKLPGELAV